MESSTQRELAYEAALQKMHSLETLASADWPAACHQMIALYPVASERYMHDICDGVDLWIFERGLTADLADHLRHLSSRENDAALVLRYEQWLALTA